MKRDVAMTTLIMLIALFAIAPGPYGVARFLVIGCSIILAPIWTDL